MIELFQAAIPELTRHPLYVLPSVPSHYPPMPATRAFTLVGQTDYAIRAELIERGEWQGPGNTIVLCNNEQPGDSLWGLLAHEVTHCLPARDPQPEREVTPAEIEFQKFVVYACAQEKPAVSKLPPWEPHHGWRFIRRCLHVWHRINAMGVEVGLPSLSIAGDAYEGLSLPFKYAHALGNEPKRMARASFREIEATKAPRSFLKTWRREFTNWYTKGTP